MREIGKCLIAYFICLGMIISIAIFNNNYDKTHIKKELPVQVQNTR